MEIKRRLQLGAVAVIANGLLSLMVMAPREAQANPCASINQCVTGNSCTNWTALCQQLAPSGCTVTSFTCQYDVPGCPINPPIFLGTQVTCHYN
jgi:hypothetical protein